MRKTIFTLTLAGLAIAGRLLAGGFWLQLGNPEASAEARKLNAAVTIKAVGCHDPASAKVTATAIGMVNGERRAIPLDVVKMSEPGTFAIARQWPKEGKWVIQLTGRNNDNQFTNTLISASPAGLDRLHAKSDMHEFATADVEALLR